MEYHVPSAATLTSFHEAALTRQPTHEISDGANQVCCPSLRPKWCTTAPCWILKSKPCSAGHQSILSFSAVVCMRQGPNHSCRCSKHIAAERTRSHAGQAGFVTGTGPALPRSSTAGLPIAEPPRRTSCYWVLSAYPLSWSFLVPPAIRCPCCLLETKRRKGNYARRRPEGCCSKKIITMSCLMALGDFAGLSRVLWILPLMSFLPRRSMLLLWCLRSSRSGPGCLLLMHWCSLLLLLLVCCADWPAARAGGCVGVVCRVGASTHRPWHKIEPIEEHCKRKR